MESKTIKYRPIERIIKEGNKKKIDASPEYSNLKESLHFQKNMETIENRVVSILKGDRYARKKDWWLIILYWAKMGYIKVIIPEEQIGKITPPESITRVKRKLIKEAKEGKEELQFLLKDKENIEIRESHEELYREYFRK